MNGATKSNNGRKRYKFEAPIVRTIISSTKGKTWYGRLRKFLTRKIEYITVEDYTCYLPFLHVTLFIPKGFRFDGASIPRFLWPIIAPVDILLIAAIFHDFAYRYRTYLTVDGILYLNDLEKGTYDSIFRKMSIVTNGLTFTSWAAYFAITVFGWIPWNENRHERNRLKRDFPHLFVDPTIKIQVDPKEILNA